MTLEQGQFATPPAETVAPPDTTDTTIFEDDRLDGQFLQRKADVEPYEHVDVAALARAQDDAQNEPTGGVTASQAYQGDATPKGFEQKPTMEQQAQADYQERQKAILLKQGQDIADMIATGTSPEEAMAEMGGLEQPVYDPVDLFVDVATGFTSSLSRAGLKAIARGEVKQGLKATGRAVLTDVAFGGAAGAAMAASEDLGPLVQALSGVVGPVAASALLTGGRKAVAGWLKRVSTDNTDTFKRLIKAMEEAGDTEAAATIRQFMEMDQAGKLDIQPGASVKDVSATAGAQPAEYQAAIKAWEKQGTDSPYFQKWFGDSQVVDESGQPLVVYHGTASDFEQFRVPKKARGNAYDRDSGVGVFFTAQPEQADYFAFVAASSKKKTAFASPEGQRSVPVYLSMKNPLTVDYSGEVQFKRPEEVLRLSKEAKAGGYDGLILKGVYDAPIGKPGDIYVAFEPTQIKSVFNRGTFDPNDPRIGMSVHDVSGGEAFKDIPAKAGQEVAPKQPSMADQKTLYDQVQQKVDETSEMILAMPEGAAPTGDKAGNINLRYIEEPEDIQALVEQVAKQYTVEKDAAVRGVKSDEAIKALAAELGMDERTLLKRKIGQTYNAEQLLAARYITWKSANDLMALAKQIRAGDNSDTVLAAFKQRMAVHAALQMQLSGATAEAGRALRQFQITAKSADFQMQQVGDVVAGGGGRVSVQDQAIALAKLAELNGGELTAAQANTFIRQAQKATTMDMLLEVWINSLLSGPTTHATNTLSNSLVALWQVPERGMASLVSSIPRVGSGSIHLGEMFAQSYGMMQGFMDGLRILGKGAKDIALLRPYDGPDSLTKIDVGRFGSISGQSFKLKEGGFPARAVDMLGEAVRIPGKALQVEDDFFKAIGYRMELQAQAFRTAKAEGLGGADLAARIREIVAAPPENIKMSAINAARYQTFTNELGKWGKGIQRLASSNKAMRIVIPFVRTPMNIMKFALERTIAAPMFSEFRAAIAKGGPERDLALARVALGSMVMGTTAGLASSGYITGGGPSDTNHKSLMYDTGWQPYSIKIGGTYYSYARLEPLGSLLGMSADTMEIMSMTNNPEERDSLAATIVMAFSKNITSKTFLRGVSDLMNVFSDPDRYGERYIGSLAGTVIPTGVAQFNRAFLDPTLRDTRSLLDSIKSRTPGLSDNIPPRTNTWGRDITLDGALGPDILSPIYASKEHEALASRELLRLGYNMPKPQRNQSFNGVTLELDQLQYYRLMRLYGQEGAIDGRNFEETIAALADGSHPQAGKYQALSDGPDGGKVVMIQRIRQAYLAQARAMLLEEFPELKERIADLMYEKQDALAPAENTSGTAPISF